MEKIKISFISQQNATRSILAEAICMHLYADKFEVYSAGVEPRSHIVCDVSKTLMRNYGIVPLSEPKHISEIPVTDIVVVMGEDVDVDVEAKYSENFGLDDPMHKLDEIFDLTCTIIELRLEKIVQNLANIK
jgi:arsenate reductase